MQLADGFVELGNIQCVQFVLTQQAQTVAQVRRVPTARVNRDPAARELNERASDSDLGEMQADLNEVLIRNLSADGYASAEVRLTSIPTEIIICATREARYGVREGDLRLLCRSDLASQKTA